MRVLTVMVPCAELIDSYVSFALGSYAARSALGQGHIWHRQSLQYKTGLALRGPSEASYFTRVSDLQHRLVSVWYHVQTNRHGYRTEHERLFNLNDCYVTRVVSLES